MPIDTATAILQYLGHHKCQGSKEERNTAIANRTCSASYTSSSAVAKRLRGASCLSVVNFNSTTFLRRLLLLTSPITTSNKCHNLQDCGPAVLVLTTPGQSQR